MSQEIFIKIGFTSHDHKAQININDINRISKQINEPITINELNNFSDEFAYALHNSSVDLIQLFTKETLEKFWVALEPFRYGVYDECPELSPYIHGDILIIPIDELSSYVNSKS